MEELERCIAGDPAAWRALLAAQLPVIRGSVRRTLLTYRGDAPEALVDDACGEVLLKLVDREMRLLRRFDPARAKLSTWLSLIARTTTIDVLRRRRETAPLEAAPEAAAPEPEEAPELVIPPGLLSARQRLVVQLAYHEGLEVPEIAARLEVSEQTVRSMRHKAIKKLREHFGERPPC